VTALVQCCCGGELCRRSPVTRRPLAYTLRYRCAGCHRSVPWCFGAADDLPEMCDDCWMQRTKTNSTPEIKTVE